jgi:hypothetical protein
VSLDLYLFYMVLFIGLGAWVLFLALMKDRDEPDDELPADDTHSDEKSP